MKSEMHFNPAVNAAIAAAFIVSIMFFAAPVNAQSSTPVGETVTEGE